MLLLVVTLLAINDHQDIKCYFFMSSGFTDLSPEELRLEYYSTRASGDLQTYVSVQECHTVVLLLIQIVGSHLVLLSLDLGSL